MLSRKTLTCPEKLDSEESKARKEAHLQKETIRARFVLERDEQLPKYREAQQRFERFRRNLLSRLQPNRDELRARIFKKGNLERQFRAFVKVSPVGYLRTVIGID